GLADLYDWRLDRATGTPPLFRQIYVQVRAAILSGALAPGTKRPLSAGLGRATGPPPLFRQIYVQVRAAILSGALAPGTKLPSSRAMATKLGVARASAVAAYEQLLTEGYVVARAGSGTFV